MDHDNEEPTPSKTPGVAGDTTQKSSAVVVTGDLPATVAHVEIDRDGPAPEAVSRYRLVRMIGKGGFGEVWEAFDPDLDRAVAVKLPRRKRRFSKRALESFTAEARKMVSLKSDGILPVYDVGTHDGRPFIVSELMCGGNLASLLEANPPSPTESARKVAELAETLHHTHLQGMVHRDIKPENILLDEEGRWYLGDFGLAATEEEQLDELLQPAGTPAYMSPEQARGEGRRADARTDIYSLGVLLYRMLTRRLPFVARDFDEYQEQVLNREPRPLRTIDDAIPPELERICLKCMSKNVVERYNTARDLAADLRSAVAPARQSGRRWWYAVGAAVAIVLCVGLIWHFVGNGNNPDPPKKPADQTPKHTNIVWPGYRPDRHEVVKWMKVDGEWALKVESREPRLIQLGELPDQRCTISLRIRPVSGSSFLGVWIGYHEGRWLSQNDVSQFQWFELAHRNRIPFLRRRFIAIPPGTPTPVERKLLGTDDVQLRADQSTERITIHLAADGSVEKVMWGNRRLVNQTGENALDAERELPEFRGRSWGVCTFSGSAVFINPKLTLRIK